MDAETHELLFDYIERHMSPEPMLLRDLTRDSYLHTVNGRMVSGHLQGRLLKMLVQLTGARHIIEFGTFSGYSALCLAEGLPADGRLVTIEFDDELETRIRRWISRSPHADKIELIIGDALKVANNFDINSFDLAFIDANKRQYPEYYVEAKRIVRPGGLIIADNTLWDGHVLERNPKSAQTRAIIEFNDFVAGDPDVETVILPLRDGLTLLRLKDAGVNDCAIQSV